MKEEGFYKYEEGRGWSKYVKVSPYFEKVEELVKWDEKK